MNHAGGSISNVGHRTHHEPCRWVNVSGVDNSAGPMRVLRVSGHQFLYFFWPNGPLVSTMELFTIVIDSFHQLSLLTQQLNIICDDVDLRYQSKLVTILFTNYKLIMTN